jgi:transcriptional regulator with XRE-family HTH domain
MPAHRVAVVPLPVITEHPGVVRDIFPARLRAARARARLTQEELREALGEKHSNVRNWETRGVLPDAEKLVRLAQVLDTSTDYLLGLVDEPAVANGASPPKPLSPEALEALGEAVDQAKRRGPRPRKQDQPPAENPGQAEA